MIWYDPTQHHMAAKGDSWHSGTSGRFFDVLMWCYKDIYKDKIDVTWCNAKTPYNFSGVWYFFQSWIKLHREVERKASVFDTCMAHQQMVGTAMPSHNSLILTPGVADRVGTIFSSLADSAVKVWQHAYQHCNYRCCQLVTGNWTAFGHIKKSNVMFMVRFEGLHLTFNSCLGFSDLKPHDKVEVHWKPTTSKLSSPSLQNRAPAALAEMVLPFGTLRIAELAFI